MQPVNLTIPLTSATIEFYSEFVMKKWATDIAHLFVLTLDADLQSRRYPSLNSMQIESGIVTLPPNIHREISAVLLTFKDEAAHTIRAAFPDELTSTDMEWLFRKVDAYVSLQDYRARAMQRRRKNFEAADELSI
jgi:hypothetical protein